ncbi:MAG TPA: hemolysin family protein, partial [Methanotrichaceae archaeon]|nr:hemolysin family protein [Methanotrichaceae archaeon]
MPALVLEIALIVLLIIANGVFVMSEIAIVSARKIRLKQHADEGDQKARAALDLANSPNRFLSTTQIGITLIGTAVGAFGGAAVAKDLAVILDSVPGLMPYSSMMSIAIIVLTISYLSLVIGELVPKRLGLNSPEKIASYIAGPMIMLSVIASPVVRLLSISTDLVLKILRVKPSLEPPVTEDDIKILIDEGTRAGVFEEAEQDIVERVFRLSDRRAASLMIPRSEAICLDIDESPDEMREKISGSDYLLFPVCKGGFDNVLGFINPKYLLSCSLNNEPLDLKSSLMPPRFIPESMPALKILELFKQSVAHMALVIDE